MRNDVELKAPWLVAVWPGISHVALTAGYFLVSKLQMHALAAPGMTRLFDLEHVLVKDGKVLPLEHPRDHFYLRQDPRHKHDLVVFLAEAEPAVGKYRFCRKLVKWASEQGVERVFTFSAIATPMHHRDRSNVYVATTESADLLEWQRLELGPLPQGKIDGPSGLLLGAAAQVGLPGVCLLGEVPSFFSKLTFPRASQAVLEVFARIARIRLEFQELQAADEALAELLEQAEQVSRTPSAAEPEETGQSPQSPILPFADAERIEALFRQAKKDRTKAFQLKQELDRLGAFKDFEDRFLDLFKKADD